MFEFSKIISSDLLLALINFILAFWIFKAVAIRKRKTFTFWFICMFLSIGFAALVSGVVGFYPLSSSLISKIYLDKISAMIFGISGIAAWNIGAKLIFYKKTRIKIQRLSFVLFFLFCLSVMSTEMDFFLVLLHNSLAVIFLLYAFVIQYYRRWQKEIAFGILGIFMVLLALIIRQMIVDLDDGGFGFPFFFNLISFIASLLIYHSAKPLVKNDIN